MASLRHPAYEIIEHPEFLVQASNLTGSIRNWDEIKNTIDNDLAREPHAGELLSGTRLYGVSIASNPPLTLYYTVDDVKGTMTLLALCQV